MTNNLAYCLAVEKLLGLEIPERAQILRVLLNELTRIQSHLVWLGTHAMDIGALTVFLYCFREREDLLRIFEAVSGQRMMTSYFRIGGLSLAPPMGFHQQVQSLLDIMPGRIDQYENLLTSNPIWMGRIKGVGYLSPEDAIALGVTGPPARASGTCGGTCRTRGMSDLSSRYPSRRMAMSGRGTWCASRRCASR
jgi:NADH-quinone oxidoreductase subunit D